MRTPRLLRALPLLALLLSPAASAGKNAIIGQVETRNGQPVERAIVTLEPGNVQIITDVDGRFLIDYLRDDEGERTKLAKKTEYTVEIFKPGFHTHEVKFFYKRGTVVVDTITLKEDTLEVADDGQSLDPGLFGDRTHAAGATYEGQ